MSMQLAALHFSDGTHKVVLLPDAPTDADGSRLRLTEPVSVEICYHTSLQPWYAFQCIVTDVDSEVVTLRPFWNLRITQRISTSAVISVRHIETKSLFSQLGERHRLPDIFKSHFIDALLSGLYPKGESCTVLTHAGTFGVLGVACKAAGVRSSELLFHSSIPRDAAFSHVPDILKAESSEDAAYLCRVLEDLHHAGFSFRQIAHFIRTNL